MFFSGVFGVFRFGVIRFLFPFVGGISPDLRLIRLVLVGLSWDAKFEVFLKHFHQH